MLIGILGVICCMLGIALHLSIRWAVAMAKEAQAHAHEEFVLAGIVCQKIRENTELEQANTDLRWQLDNVIAAATPLLEQWCEYEEYEEKRRAAKPVGLLPKA